jgi:hypothetical protein
MEAMETADVRVQNWRSGLFGVLSFRCREWYAALRPLIFLLVLPHPVVYCHWPERSFRNRAGIELGTLWRKL